jgi:hypothetical protein
MTDATAKLILDSAFVDGKLEAPIVDSTASHRQTR